MRTHNSKTPPLSVFCRLALCCGPGEPGCLLLYLSLHILLVLEISQRWKLRIFSGFFWDASCSRHATGFLNSTAHTGASSECSNFSKKLCSFSSLTLEVLLYISTLTFHPQRTQISFDLSCFERSNTCNVFEQTNTNLELRPALLFELGTWGSHTGNMGCRIQDCHQAWEGVGPASRNATTLFYHLKLSFFLTQCLLFRFSYFLLKVLFLSQDPIWNTNYIFFFFLIN